MRVIEDALLIAFVAVVIVTDWRWQRIPNLATYPTMLVGLVLGALEATRGIGVGVPFGEGFLDHLSGLVLAFLVAYPFYAMRGLRAGDAKMLMAIGSLKGTVFVLNAALYGALFGLVVPIFAVIFGRTQAAAPDEPSAFPLITDRMPPRVRNALRTWFPYGVALGIGALVALVARP